MVKENAGAIQVLSKVVRKRGRQSTPKEELDVVKKKSFKMEEKRFEKRITKADKAWRQLGWKEKTAE